MAHFFWSEIDGYHFVLIRDEVTEIPKVSDCSDEKRHISH